MERTCPAGADRVGCSVARAAWTLRPKRCACLPTRVHAVYAGFSSGRCVLGPELGNQAAICLSVMRCPVLLCGGRF
eukprot:3658990-Rhodomonas_salina.1